MHIEINYKKKRYQLHRLINIDGENNPDIAGKV